MATTKGLPRFATVAARVDLSTTVKKGAEGTIIRCTNQAEQKYVVTFTVSELPPYNESASIFENFVRLIKFLLSLRFATIEVFAKDLELV